MFSIDIPQHAATTIRLLVSGFVSELPTSDCKVGDSAVAPTRHQNTKLKQNKSREVRVHEKRKSGMPLGNSDFMKPMPRSRPPPRYPLILQSKVHPQKIERVYRFRETVQTPQLKAFCSHDMDGLGIAGT